VVPPGEAYLFLLSLVYSLALSTKESGTDESKVMAKQQPQPAVKPLLDLLTADEIHRALVRHVLMRKAQAGQIQVEDVDAFLAAYNVQSRVFYRDVKHGSEVVMEAAVSIDGATAKQSRKAAPPPASETPTGE